MRHLLEKRKFTKAGVDYWALTFWSDTAQRNTSVERIVVFDNTEAFTLYNELIKVPEAQEIKDAVQAEQSELTGQDKEATVTTPEEVDSSI